MNITTSNNRYHRSSESSSSLARFSLSSFSSFFIILLSACIYHGDVCHSFSFLKHDNNNNNFARSSKKNRVLLRAVLKDEGQTKSVSYPVASRQYLIEKAKEIDPALAEGKKTGSYSKISWSNRLGSVLTPAAIPGVYMAERPFLWNKIDVGGRMAVIQLSSSSDGEKPDLFVHSPVCLDGPLLDALDKLGTVKHIVSPNYEHLKYAKMWADHFKEANIWGCPGMIEQEPQISWTGEIPYGVRPKNFPLSGGMMKVEEGSFKAGIGMKADSKMWDWNEIQPMHVDCEVNPFTGKPFFNEVVFFHTPSNSLLTTDVYWNYPDKAGVTNSNVKELPDRSDDFGVWELAPEVGKIPFGSRAWKFGMDNIYRPFFVNLMIKSEQRNNFNDITRFMSGKNKTGWQTETLVPAHGDLIRGTALVTNILSKHFNID